MSSTTTYSPMPLSWKQADDNVYVATRGGEYAGFVESDSTAHVAYDNHGVNLGSFASLVDARQALEGTPRRSMRSIRQTLRRHLSRVRA